MTSWSDILLGKMTVIFYGLTLCLLLWTPPARAQTSPPNDPTSHLNASAELQRLLDKDEAARKKGDSLTRLAVALQLKTLLNDAGDVLLATADAYSVVRDSTKVFETLTDYARLGLDSKEIVSGQDKKFTWLAKSPRFANVCRLLKANTTPVHRATPVLRFPQSDYLPEDIDYDQQGRCFLFTSILQHGIFRLALDGSCRKFAASPSGWPVMAIKIDNRKELVWATEVAMPGFGGLADSIQGRSAVGCYDLRSGKLRQRFEAPDGAQWGDMTLDPQGDPIVSDGQLGAIYRLRDGHWQRLDKGDFISPQTPALTRDGKHLLVPDYVRGLAVMDLETSAISWVQNNPAHPCALNGIDGVYVENGRLLITQNGVTPERVVEIRLNNQGGGASYYTLTGYTIIEKATHDLGEPTHGVFVGGNFYFIANSGWDALDPHGKPKPGAHMSRPTLMRYHLTTPQPPFHSLHPPPPAGVPPKSLPPATSFAGYSVSTLPRYR